MGIVEQFSNRLPFVSEWARGMHDVLGSNLIIGKGSMMSAKEAYVTEVKILKK